MAAPRTFFMEMPQPAGAILVFDARAAGSTGEYEVYSISPEEKSRFWGQWDALRERRTPTGRIPVTDVDWDDDNHVIRVRTLGLESFVRA